VGRGLGEKLTSMGWGQQRQRDLFERIFSFLQYQYAWGNKGNRVPILGILIKKSGFLVGLIPFLFLINLLNFP
jgi:hypothetical protein